MAVHLQLTDVLPHYNEEITFFKFRQYRYITPPPLSEIAWNVISDPTFNGGEFCSFRLLIGVDAILYWSGSPFEVFLSKPSV